MVSNASDEQMHWKVLKSDYLHREPWLTVRKEQLLMPNGKVVPEYYVLEYSDWVNIIAITNENRFVFVKQYRHAIGQVCYELCAGVSEAGDHSPLDAARRELMEETGFGGGRWTEFMRIAPNASANNNYSYCFVAQGVEKIGEQSLDDTEDLTVHLLSMGQVKELLTHGRIVQATMAAPLWKYMAENHLI